MRPRCDGCGRPKSVCLCSKMPSSPLSTSPIIILQHPSESSHKLATVPILARCLQSCQVITGRKFHPGMSPHLDALASQNNEGPLISSDNNLKERALLLFPAPDAVDLSSWASDNVGPWTLLVVDATWEYAKEMVKASRPFLDKFVLYVCLPFDLKREGYRKGDSGLILRKEPFHGYISTMEAVARALGVLERDGLTIERTLLSVLHRMVELQARFLPERFGQQKPTIEFEDGKDGP